MAIRAVLTLLLFLGLTLNAHAELRKFEMTIEEFDFVVAPGLTTKVWAYDGQVPGPLIHVKEGDNVEVKVQNNTTMSHTIHFHGTYQTHTWEMDGVPGVSQQAIEPGDSFTYRFVADKPGSLWYHCHVNTAEHIDLRGMWGPMIVDPKTPTELEKQVAKDAIVMFAGWDSSVAKEYGKNGVPHRVLDYFSINGKAHPGNQPIRVKEGDVLRLRLYAPTSPVAFHLHGHDALVTHKDGLPIPAPYPVDVIAMQPGERYDLIVKMNNPGIWMAHDHIEEHTTSGGKEGGGSMLVVEYEDIKKPGFYMWKDLKYDPDFYMSESLKKPYGKHNNPSFMGFDPSRPPPAAAKAQAHGHGK
jgi:manganese oxidase